jgi:hypothetical protein
VSVLNVLSAVNVLIVATVVITELKETVFV